MPPPMVQTDTESGLVEAVEAMTGGLEAPAISVLDLLNSYTVVFI